MTGRFAALRGSGPGRQLTRFASNSRVHAVQLDCRARARHARGSSSQRPLRRLAEIRIERSGHAILDDIDRARDGEGRHRHAAGHRLEIHESKGIGETREHQHVGRGQVGCQILAVAKARVHGLAVARLEARALRARPRSRSSSRATASAGTRPHSSRPPGVPRTRRSGAAIAGTPCSAAGTIPCPRRAASARDCGSRAHGAPSRPTACSPCSVARPRESGAEPRTRATAVSASGTSGTAETACDRRS